MLTACPVPVRSDHLARLAQAEGHAHQSLRRREEAEDAHASALARLKAASHDSRAHEELRERTRQLHDARRAHDEAAAVLLHRRRKLELKGESLVNEIPTFELTYAPCSLA